MKPSTKATPRLWARYILLTAALVVIAGCASIRATTGAPISDMSLIAGKWAGTIDRGGSEDPFYLTINADGTLTAAWARDHAWGKVMLQSGKATFEMEPGVYEGTVTLYDDGGKRTLVLDDLWKSFRARVAPEG
jgi:hypothetical protein